MASLRPFSSLILVSVVSAALASPALAQGLLDAEEPQTVKVLHCGTLLVDARQAPRTEQTLVIKEGKVQAALPGYVAPQDVPGITGEDVVELVDLKNRFVLPGLIDCHTHITGEYGPRRRIGRVEDTDADIAIRATVFAKRTLMAGFTTIRNVGSSGDAVFALRDAIKEGLVPGPRILAAGESISPTGGHSDSTLGYKEGIFPTPGPYEGIADGVPSCRKAVRAQVKRGADVIKITATGGVLSATSAGTEAQFFPDELKALVDTSHQLGRKIAAHAHGVGGIKAALRAGVDSIEHGTFLDQEAIALFKQTGAYLVPTVMAGKAVTEWAEIPGFFPPPVVPKARTVGPVIQGALAQAHRGGVKIAFGTDCGVSPHGTNAEEFVYMVEAGLTPQQTLIAATVNAADLCGLSESVGTLAKGRQGDVIAVANDPLQDVKTLQRVVFVMRGVTVYKK